MGEKNRQKMQKIFSITHSCELFSPIESCHTHKRREREVAVVDLPESLLSAHMEGDILMVLKEKLSLLMVNTAPHIYQKYITTTTGNDPGL